MSSLEQLIKDVRKAATVLPVRPAAHSPEGRAHALLADLLADLTRLAYESEHAVKRVTSEE